MLNSWNSIYNYVVDGLSKANISVESLSDFKNAYVESHYGEGHYFYGPDWVENEELADRLRWATENSLSFNFFAPVVNKGTLDTLQMLLNNKDNKEVVVLIYIAAFLQMCDYQNRSRIYLNIDRDIFENFKSIIWSKFNEFGLYRWRWHFASTQQLPVTLNYKSFEPHINKISKLLDLIISNIVLVINSYTLLLWDSRIDSQGIISDSCIC